VDRTLIIILASALVLLMGAMGWYLLGTQSRRHGGGNLRRAGRELMYAESSEDDVDLDEQEEQEDDIDEPSKKVGGRKKEPTIDEKLFMAGRLSERERRDFRQKQMLAPLVFGIVGLVLGVFVGSSDMIMLGGVLGVILGVYLPLKIINSWVVQQHEDISYYLPLVIEQISIGVSSSLDIGPCLSRIVQMADERKSHNAVTELLKYSQYYVKSGVSLEESLKEIGRASGHSELKHVLLALSQVAKFGGEISKQLQDLADAVGAQREAKIEERIRKLELKASGPVALVFMAYMILLFIGIGSEVLKIT
jgi:Flp pilus assembly protein TadB